MVVDGKKIAEELRAKLETELLFAAPQKVCFLVIGGNAATAQFVKTKSKLAEQVGINVEVEEYADIKTTEEAVSIARSLGKRDYNGIVVQLPLPVGFDTQAVLDAIPPEKDIDMLGSVAKKSYLIGEINRTPPVAQAVFEILQSCRVSLKNMKIVLLGQGRLVGEPMHLMLTRMSIPHDIIDVNTEQALRDSLIKNADIVISGMGVPHSIKADMIKKGVVLIDAGTSEQGGKLVGDIDPECASRALWITPVPGGVGPVTIVSLLRNLV